MELNLNLNNKYYEKYIKYKKRYIMLRQLKNNNELEGGMFGQFFADWFSKKPDQVAPEEPQDTTKYYLVFHVPDTTDASKLKMFKNLVIKNVVKKSTLSNSEENNEENNEVTNDADEINKTFMNKIKFINEFKQAYIITNKKDSEGNFKTDYTLVDEDSTTILIRYNQIKKHFDNSIRRCEVPPFKIIENNTEQDGGVEDENNDSDMDMDNAPRTNNSKINVLNVTIPKKINDAIEILNKDIKESITKLVNDKKKELLELPEIKKLNSYIPNVIKYGYDLEDKDKDANERFLKNFYGTISTGDTNTGIPKPNMIFQIEKNDNEKYILEINNQIMVTTTFLQITATINQANVIEKTDAVAKL
jgi:hypothetical protein